MKCKTCKKNFKRPFAKGRAPSYCLKCRPRVSRAKAAVAAIKLPSSTKSVQAIAASVSPINGLLSQLKTKKEHHRAEINKIDSFLEMAEKLLPTL